MKNQIFDIYELGSDKKVSFDLLFTGYDYELPDSSLSLIARTDKGNFLVDFSNMAALKVSSAKSNSHFEYSVLSCFSSDAQPVENELYIANNIWLWEAYLSEEYNSSSQQLLELKHFFLLMENNLFVNVLAEDVRVNENVGFPLTSDWYLDEFKEMLI